MRLAISLTIIALVLAGCTGKDEPLAAGAIEEEDADATPTSPAPSPTPNPSSPRPSPSPSPSASPSGPSNGTTSPGTPPAPATVVVTGDMSAMVMVGAPDPVFATGAGVAFAVLDLPGASPKSGTLAAVWTSQTPLDASMDIRLEDVDGNLIASGSGASPLVVEIPGEGFGAATELRGIAFPTAPGASVMYTVTFALTVTYA